MSIIAILMYFCVFLAAGFMCLIAIIAKGVGFNTMWHVFRSKLMVKKGYGMIKIYHKTGSPELVSLKFKDIMTPFGEEQGRYLYKHNCVYLNEFQIPTLEYREGESEPRDPRTGLQTVTSPKILSNIVARCVKAESQISRNPFDWLKSNWVTLGTGLLILVGIFAFLYLRQIDTISELTTKLAACGKTVIVNGTTLP